MSVQTQHGAVWPEARDGSHHWLEGQSFPVGIQGYSLCPLQTQIFSPLGYSEERLPYWRHGQARAASSLPTVDASPNCSWHQGALSPNACLYFKKLTGITSRNALLTPGQVSGPGLEGCCARPVLRQRYRLHLRPVPMMNITSPQCSRGWNLPVVL